MAKREQRVREFASWKEDTNEYKRDKVMLEALLDIAELLETQNQLLSELKPSKK
jgi:hypothetical protein